MTLQAVFDEIKARVLHPVFRHRVLGHPRGDDDTPASPLLTGVVHVTEAELARCGADPEEGLRLLLDVKLHALRYALQTQLSERIVDTHPGIWVRWGGVTPHPMGGQAAAVEFWMKPKDELENGELTGRLMVEKAARLT